MLVLVALSRTAFTAVAATSYGHTLRQHAARAVLNAYDGPDEVVTERVYVGPREADEDWATKYEGPREADADWATTYEGPREADADWANRYEGPHEAAGVWSLPSVLSLMDASFGSPLSDFNATMVDGVSISSFHTLFDRCYEPAAPGCVRRCGSRPVPYQPCPPTMSPCEPPACLSTAKHPLSPHPSSLQELVVEGGYHFANRFVVLVAVEICGERRYVPMLCDTGAPKTCISTTALEKFGFETSAASHINIKLGQRSVYAAIPDESCATPYVRGLNILGSDVLQLLVPDLVPFVISSINGDATRPSK